MSKSLLAIAGLGVAGCLLLGLMKKQLELRQQAQRTTQWMPVMTSRFGAHLAGPLVSHEEHVGGITRVVVSGRAAAGKDRQGLAAAMAAEAWQFLGEGTRAGEVQVTLRDAKGLDPVSKIVARPTPAR